jgi:serine phosphatase RsbU (regulator of sigma subunit)
MKANSKLLAQLAAALIVAFLASLGITWTLHNHIMEADAYKLIDIAFKDVEDAIRERVDRRLVRQTMLFRDKLAGLKATPVWKDPKAAAPILRKLADELMVDELCVVDENGILTHASNLHDIGFDFKSASGQARAFLPLLDDVTEVTQPLMPNSNTGDVLKYAGVWLPEGGFVQVGCREASLRHISRTALVGLTNNRHVSGEEGFIVITTATGTIISHADPTRESGQWVDPGEDYYLQHRRIEGFPVYVVIPKKTAIVERRVLVGTSAFLNAMALIVAALLVGIVIASYVRSQIRAQRSKEMAMAQHIQENAIPRVFPPFPDEKRVDIFADMKTAKEVGGDFYDFYFSGQHKITFVIADVSDKGVPAALFMMRAKTILKSIAQTGKTIAEVVTEANEALCEGNEDANMFVTAWIGEIDLSTGVVSFVNAGHNPPLLLRSGAKPEFIRSNPQLVLAAMSGYKYRSFQVTLAPGDALYLYTDGITEQPDAHGELFGEERLMSIFETQSFKDDSECIGAVLDSVSAHAGDVEQSDDRTQLVIRYNGLQ